MAWIGRPKKYNSAVEKMKAYREAKKKQGAVRIDCYIPYKYAAMMNIVRQNTKAIVSSWPRTLKNLEAHFIKCLNMSNYNTLFM